ncbi:MAG: hypothetical protein ACI94Y_001157, partial [Maribacter sp.]
MSHLLSIPFYGFKLKFVSGGHIATPMMHQQMVFPDRTINQLSAYFRKAFQTKVLDKGAYASILDQYTDGDFLHGEIEVEFTASKDKMSYPDFTLEFKYFYKRNERGFWAIVPVIGVEVFIDND